MALYQHQDAQLGEIEGTGYLFRKQTPFGDQYQGVFFAPDDASDKMEQLQDADSVTFSGIAYKKNRSGKVSSNEVEFEVDVKSLTTVAMGERALLEVVED